MRPTRRLHLCSLLLGGSLALACAPHSQAEAPQLPLQTSEEHGSATGKDGSNDATTDKAIEPHDDTSQVTRLLELTTTRASLLEVSLEDACGEGEYAPSEEAALVLPSALSGPYRRVTPLTCQSGPFSTQRLLIETSAGTFQSEFVLYFSMAVSGAQTGGMTLDEVTLQQVVKGGPPELVVRVRGNLSSGGSSPDYYETQTEDLYVCGLAGDGVPACSEPLRISLKHQGDEGNQAYALAVEFPAEGGVLLAPKTLTLDEEATSLLGVYQLILP